MQLTPLIVFHAGTALAALAIGPVVLWSRMGRLRRPRLHRLLGYTWVALILVAALSSLFIRDFRLPNVAGYTPIHLLVPVTLGSLCVAFAALARGHVVLHRRTMQLLYLSACVVTGALTLLPGRAMHDLVLRQWLGLV
ncbi:DUF2306 domain-containing protein [Ramlibacter sp. AW1]|uniref:DUF2306 domain-containing protein n=1 Tax=Ramlibacter aurantiacus TaxID=2801330 RepID=A0A936ZNS0_9BURK|nr:DUF2306 domain-containing protein [Ramlibacter aurantiacus]MBL0421021.1 DUF2306 domain-containing protein [Ramlibacter aurantiacus]